MGTLLANKEYNNQTSTDIYLDATAAPTFEVSLDDGATYTAWDLTTVATYPAVVVSLPDDCKYRVSVDTPFSTSTISVK